MTSITISRAAAPDKYPSKEHAERVVQQLGVKHGLIYLQSARTQYLEDSDQFIDFRQRRYFYYLSGCDEADCHVTYDIAKKELTLWLAPFTPRQVVWLGRGSTIDEAYDRYAIDLARYANDLEAYLKDAPSPIYALHADPTHLPPGYALDVGIDISALLPAMNACRVIKDPHEIALIARANAISTEAHKAVLQTIRQFTNEAQVAATILATCVAHQAPKQAYSIIAGSGPNGSVLHYSVNNASLEGQHSMVLDAGAEYNLYASDVTRSFPLAGYWSKEGQEIYNLVNYMQTQSLGLIGPGKRLVTAHLMCHRWAVRGLLRLGILKNGTEDEILATGLSTAFYPHGLGHHLGLEVHDVLPPRTPSTTAAAAEVKQIAGFEQDVAARICAIANNICTLSSDALQPGMVITVEPGIYFNRYALETLYKPVAAVSKFVDWDVLEKYYPVGGVRIEDDILITAYGWKNLTTTPKGEEALQIIRRGQLS